MKNQQLLILAGLLASLIFGNVSPSEAQETKSSLGFHLPFEVAQGSIIMEGQPRLYTTSFRLHPTVGFGKQRKFRVGLSGAVEYFNPKVDYLGGARVSYNFFNALSIGELNAGLHLAIEALRGTDDRKTVGGALIGDGFGVIQITTRIARELKEDVTIFEVGVGLDLGLFGKGGRKTPEPPRDPFPGLDGFWEALAIRMSVLSSWLNDPAHIIPLKRSRELFFEGSRQPSIDSLKTFLLNNGQTRLAGNVEETITGVIKTYQDEGKEVPDLTSDKEQRLAVIAIVRGWLKVLSYEKKSRAIEAE